MPRRFMDRMRSAVSASALRATQQKVRAALHLASSSRGSALVMRAISEMVPARSGMSAGTANTESTEIDIASSRPARS